MYLYVYIHTYMHTYMSIECERLPTLIHRDGVRGCAEVEKPVQRQM
jgi:hypothetical protein